MNGTSIYFGLFELDTESCELRRSGRRVRLRPQACRVLAALACRAGELVTREQLREQIWGKDTFVDFEHGLNLCIRQVREALGDAAESPRFIETIPRRGYRFIAPLNGLETARAAGPAPSFWANRFRVAGFAAVAVTALAGMGWWGWESARPAPPSSRVMLAVLPFQNMSGDTGQDYLSEGITEELTSDLGQLRPDRFGVIARSSVERYKGAIDVRQVAGELGVAYILEGSVRRENANVRVSARLIRARDQSDVWAASYSDELPGVLALEERVARTVAAQVAGKLQEPATPGRKIRPEAWEAYLRGRYELHQLTQRHIERAAELFEIATATDPNDARSYASLSVAFNSLSSFYADPREMMPRAREAALRAVELDPNLPDAHAALGTVKFYYDRDWVGAQREFQRALELDPNLTEAYVGYANVLAASGRRDLAFQQARTAFLLDPMPHVGQGNGLWLCYVTRHYQEAIQQCEKTLVSEPGYGWAHSILALSLFYTGDRQRSLAEAKRGSELAANPVSDAVLGFVEAKTGHGLEARRLARKLVSERKSRFVCGFNLAALYAALGDKEKAFASLEEGYKQRST